MNHVGIFLRFENTGSGICTLYGYPGLGLENAKHQAVKTKAIWGSTYFLADPGKHTVIRIAAARSGSNGCTTWVCSACRSGSSLQRPSATPFTSARKTSRGLRAWAMALSCRLRRRAVVSNYYPKCGLRVYGVVTSDSGIRGKAR